MQMNITPELQVESNEQVEFAVIPALMEARIKCMAGVRSVRGGKRDIISRPVTGRDSFILYISR